MTKYAGSLFEKQQTTYTRCFRQRRQGCRRPDNKMSVLPHIRPTGCRKPSFADLIGESQNVGGENGG